jgi:L,D-transpeptidase catalytic domain
MSRLPCLDPPAPSLRPRRSFVVAVAACAAAGAASTGASAAGLGGGLIEFLFSGGAPSAAPQRQAYAPDADALRYGIGRPGFTWAGVKTVTMKKEWPDWRPPDEMLRRRPDLPHYMPGGPENPLGARALYLGDTLYRIHGSNEPWTIGTQVSSGCIRMRNEDVIDLYGRVPVGARVIVI